MKTRLTDNARRLIGIIGEEYEMARTRVENGHIRPSQRLGVVYERLNRKAVSDPDLRAFLDTLAIVPVVEDDSLDLDQCPWAEDPRDENFHQVVGLEQDTPVPVDPPRRLTGAGLL